MIVTNSSATNEFNMKEPDKTVFDIIFKDVTSDVVNKSHPSACLLYKYDLKYIKERFSNLLTLSIKLQTLFFSSPTKLFVIKKF